ncbi:Aminoacylase-1 [Smittium mucronatum]|uniref:Aminoacylase-1 n=1 Tax=Smittium mucronatum TaxID=133383 RepID=A0A1R0GM24_9FUNG|nr:Aminoacylase-1 [Smittium mucronatum]
MATEELPSVTRFRQFLQIKTVQPNPDYAKCAEFLVSQGNEIGLQSTVLEESWTHPPFAADRVQTEDGDFKIFARGSQDMKVTGSIFFLFILNIDAYDTQGTAIEKLLPVINELMELRNKNEAKVLEFDPKVRSYRSGEVTSINLTGLEGGKQPNVVPATYSVTFDIRISPTDDLEAFRSYLSNLAASNGVEMKILRPNETRTLTKIDRSNLFIRTFFENLESKNLEIVPIICPGNTDARYVRSKGIPAFGFNPMINTPLLAHNHDEYVLESQYLYGIDIYTDLIQSLANC